MRLLITCWLLAFSACGANAQGLSAIDMMDYSSGNSAQNAWMTSHTSLPVEIAPDKTPDGFQALAFTCDMSKVEGRVYWDRKLDVNLMHRSAVTFWVKAVGDLSAVSMPTFYFQSNGGWYRTLFTIEKDKWYKVILDRSAFNSEEEPAGWDKITGIRLAFWKAMPSKVKIYIGPIGTKEGEVVVVRNSRAIAEVEPWPTSTAEALSAAGIETLCVDDVDVEKGALKDKRIAVFPLNPTMSDAELDAVEDFVRSGGKIVVFFALNERLGKLLGIKDVKFMIAQPENQFRQIIIVPSEANQSIKGLPDKIIQNSWNVRCPIVMADGSRVLAQWHNKNGEDTGYPAISINENGMFVSHVLLNDDPVNRGKLLRAIFGYFDPNLWQKIVEANAISLNQMFTGQDNFSDALAAIEKQAKKMHIDEALDELSKANIAYKNFLLYSEKREWQQASNNIDLAIDAAVQSYALAQITQPDEFRAVWCHSAYGVPGMNWDEAIKNLKDNGFNAIVVNMLRAGRAEYYSSVLPVGPSVEKEGDQIELCLKAAKKYGVRVYVWKVCWDLNNAGKEFIDQMKDQNRLQASRTNIELPWLCPSNPQNQQLERESLLEVIKKYDVDGIHFDFIRYLNNNYCYCQGCRKRFEKINNITVTNWPADVLPNGIHYDSYQSFRRNNITELVKTVSEEAHKIKPSTKVSAAVFANWPQCRDDVGQDWAKWVELGYMDFICPMNYTSSLDGFDGMIQIENDITKGKIPVYPGIGASSPGLSIVQVIDQILLTREKKTNGFIIFNYDKILSSQILPYLGKAITRP